MVGRCGAHHAATQNDPSPLFWQVWHTYPSAFAIQASYRGVEGVSPRCCLPLTQTLANLADAGFRTRRQHKSITYRSHLTRAISTITPNRSSVLPGVRTRASAIEPAGWLTNIEYVSSHCCLLLTPAGLGQHCTGCPHGSPGLRPGPVPDRPVRRAAAVFRDCQQPGRPARVHQHPGPAAAWGGRHQVSVSVCVLLLSRVRV